MLTGLALTWMIATPAWTGPTWVHCETAAQAEALDLIPLRMPPLDPTKPIAWRHNDDGTASVSATAAEGLEIVVDPRPETSADGPLFERFKALDTGCRVFSQDADRVSWTEPGSPELRAWFSPDEAAAFLDTPPEAFEDPPAGFKAPRIPGTGWNWQRELGRSTAGPLKGGGGFAEALCGMAEGPFRSVRIEATAPPRQPLRGRRQPTWLCIHERPRRAMRTLLDQAWTAGLRPIAIGGRRAHLTMPHGTSMAVGRFKNGLVLGDAPAVDMVISGKGEPLWRVELPDDAPVAWSHDGDSLVAKAAEDGTIEVILTRANADVSDLFAVDLPYARLPPELWCRATTEACGMASDIARVQDRVEDAVALADKGCPIDPDACRAGALARLVRDLPGDREASLRTLSRACDEDESGTACAYLGSALEDADPERADAAFRTGCERGASFSCAAAARLPMNRGQPAVDLLLRACGMNSHEYCIEGAFRSLVDGYTPESAFFAELIQDQPRRDADRWEGAFRHRALELAFAALPHCSTEACSKRLLEQIVANPERPLLIPPGSIEAMRQLQPDGSALADLAKSLVQADAGAAHVALDALQQARAARRDTDRVIAPRARAGHPAIARPSWQRIDGGCMVDVQIDARGFVTDVDASRCADPSQAKQLFGGARFEDGGRDRSRFWFRLNEP